MLRTASIRLDVSSEQSEALFALRTAYAEACNGLIPLAVQHRCWNRVALHRLGYRLLRRETPLGSQMACNAVFTVCKAYKALRENGGIEKDKPVPVIAFRRAAVHFDKRTYSLKGERLSLYTLTGRIRVDMRPGEHQRRILDSGLPKEAELIHRKGRWYFHLVVESESPEPVEAGGVLGIDVGENNFAATSTGKVFGGGKLRHERDRHLALRRRLQSNGSRSAKQRLRQVSGKEARRVRHINHETSKAIVAEARRVGVGTLVMEDLTHIRDRIRAGRRIRTRLHRWAFRQLQEFIAYKAEAAGIRVLHVNPAYTSQACSACGSLGTRVKHRFECQCGFRAHADCNSGRNLARIGESVLSPRADVDRPDVPMDVAVSAAHRE